MRTPDRPCSEAAIRTTALIAGVRPITRGEAWGGGRAARSMRPAVGLSSRSMSRPPTVASLFAPEPRRWGLRGDPFLWADMRQRFADVPCPTTLDEVDALVARVFAELTGYPFGHREDRIYVEKYAHGGMSSGYLSMPFWRLEVIARLRARHQALGLSPRRKRRCPCGSLRLAPILYDEPSAATAPLLARGEAVAGDVTDEERPRFRCRACGCGFGTSSVDAQAASRLLARLQRAVRVP